MLLLILQCVPELPAIMVDIVFMTTEATTAHVEKVTLEDIVKVIYTMHLSVMIWVNNI